MSETPSTSNRRRADRRTLQAPVRMHFEAPVVGQSDNVSAAGMLLFTDEPMRVRIEVEEDGETRSYAGRLIRVQQLNEETTGLAVEFDDESAGGDA